MDSTRSTEAGTQPVTRSGQVAETRRRLAEAAHRIFVARGFDAVTIDDIAAEAGTSRRTFFRHFATKEAVVFPDDHITQHAFRQALIHETGGKPATMTNLKALLTAMVPIYLANAELMVERRAFIDQSAALIAHEQAIFLGWRHIIAEAISGTLVGPAADEGALSTADAHIAAGAIVGAFVATFWAWYESGWEGDLGEMILSSLERLERGLGSGMLINDRDTPARPQS